MLRLAHLLGVEGLLTEAAPQLSALAQSPGGLPGSLVGWVSAAETCGLALLLRLLSAELAEQVGEAMGEHKGALLRELMTAAGEGAVGSDTLAGILSEALEVSRRSGPVEVSD